VEVKRLLIKEFLERSSSSIVLDVRSPGEYLHAHIPGAISFPLFTDEERKVVGTTYKQESREKAIKIGLDYFGPKMRKMVEQVEELHAQNNRSGEPVKEVFVHCWRGGMRSGAVAWLLNMYGFKVYTLAGGYKSFRNHVLQVLDRPYNLKVVGGYTGTGKTEVLQELKNHGEAMVDLEGIAHHKGSAFGNIGMPPQPTQEMFENLLATELEKYNLHVDAIWLEDESQRIGNLNIPHTFWKTMRQSPVYFLDIPFEERLNHLVPEYGALPKDKLADAIQRITKRLGGLETKNALQYLEEGNFTECFRILLNYYDKLYFKGLNNRENLDGILHTIRAERVTKENASLLLRQQVVI
jgi:tRNA 2-selenouridine synthase